MKRLILIAAIASAAIASTATAAAKTATVEQLEILSFECGVNSAYYSAQITVQNISGKQIDYPRAYIQFEPEGRNKFIDDVGITPRQLSPGALGSAKLISQNDDGRNYKCRLLQIQYKD